MYKQCLICDHNSVSLLWGTLKMRKCTHCGLVWQENFNIPHNHYEEYTAEADQNKSSERISDAKDRLRIFKKYARLDNLCDIGCGDGTFLSVLRASGYKNNFGIDPNDHILKPAIRNGLEVFRGRLEDFSKIMTGKNVDIVTMFHLIEHLANPKEAIQLIYDNIKNGGKLIIETPDANGYVFRKNNYVHRLIYEDHFFYFNLKNLERLLSDVGFKIIACGKRDFNPQNLNIKESLFRLGIYSPKKQNNTREARIGKIKTIKRNENKSLIGIIKNVIRKILSKIVILSGRLNYIWIMVEK